MEQFKYKYSFIKSASHVGTVVMKDFSPKKKAVVEELGGQPRKTLQILTFLLSKARPSAYRSYRMNKMCLVSLIYACVVFSTMCKASYDGVMLHVSTLSYVFLL
jgi:hypothetical protein